MLPALASQCAVCHSWPAQARVRGLRSAIWPAGARAVAPVRGLAHYFSQGCDPPNARPASQPPPLDACFAAMTYAYPWSDLMPAINSAAIQPGRRSLPRCCGERRGSEALASLEARDWLVPMPLSGERLQQRGFNQAEVGQGAGAAERAAGGLRCGPADPHPGHAVPRPLRPTSACAMSRARLRWSPCARLRCRAGDSCWSMT